MLTKHGWASFLSLFLLGPPPLLTYLVNKESSFLPTLGKGEASVHQIGGFTQMK